MSNPESVAITTLVVLAGIILTPVVIFFYLIFRFVKGSPSSKRRNFDPWLEKCKYKYEHKESGIGVDPNNETIYLMSTFKGEKVKKKYNFSSIRAWGYTLQEPGIIAGRSFDAQIARLGSAMRAAEETGLWVTVKDVDFPKWFIRFEMPWWRRELKDLEVELSRWMEILQTTVNEDSRQNNSAFTLE